VAFAPLRRLCYTCGVRDEILHKLGERVKELTALHRTARLLQDNQRPAVDVIHDVVGLLPDAWQYPEITAARIRFGPYDVATPNYIETPWVQSVTFTIGSGDRGSIEVRYLEQRQEENEGPFLAEERDLIKSLAEMLRSYFQHLLADDALRKAHDNLEQQVRERTAALSASNEALQAQIAEQMRARQQITAYQEQLRKLNSELSLAEARERRAIASDLHDHIGQALAIVRMRVSEFGGNAVFCGFEDGINEILLLLDKTIQYTRSLTFEISPPILYELGLIAAIEWLAEHFENKYGFKVKVVLDGRAIAPQEEVQIVLFKCVNELLMNTAKHAQAKRVTVTVNSDATRLRITVADDGKGFDMALLESASTTSNTFGLFSVRERLKYLGGKFDIYSIVGKGTTATLEAQS
jgi:signal transduction histidine kinase